MIEVINDINNDINYDELSSFAYSIINRLKIDDTIVIPYADIVAGFDLVEIILVIESVIKYSKDEVICLFDLGNVIFMNK